MNLASRQVDGLHTHLKTYHQIFAPLFQRREQRHWSLKYMEGQMLDLERKSIEPMARTFRDIMVSWVITIPAGAVKAVEFFYALRAIFG